MTESINHFSLLKNELATLEVLSATDGAIGYFAQEALRFHSIAGTLVENDMLKNASAAERQISHILARSLLEGFFWLVYIFDDPNLRDSRFLEKTDSFKREYGKFWNEPMTPHKNLMEPADPSWVMLPKPKDTNSILAQVKNDHGNRLSYLYFTYRIASFDTHGHSMEVLFRSAFSKDCNFSALKLDFGFDLIANQYLCTLHELRAAGEIS
jgi:hypothetical protein